MGHIKFKKIGILQILRENDGNFTNYIALAKLKLKLENIIIIVSIIVYW